MQLFPLRLVPDNTNIDFMRLKKFSLTISILVILLSFASLFIWGLNLGIDFTGGIVIELKTHALPDLTKFRSVLGHLNIGDISIQTFGGDNSLAIKIGGYFDENVLLKNVDLVKATILNQIDSEVDFRKVDFVGPQVGKQLIVAGIKSLILAFLMISIYIWFRFEWQFAAGILITLFHDIIFAFGFMSLIQLEFNMSSIAAIMTIIGYSVNDTVIIYDRLRENIRKYHKSDLDQIVNISINETLSRTTLTILTTLIANLALIIFGGEALRSFSIVMFAGILFGTYSSIYISAPILKFFKLGEAKPIISEGNNLNEARN